MKALEERILKDGQVRPGHILKVDNFLNHQMDIAFIDEIGREFYRLFKDKPINKILTIEASGIGIACLTARYFGVPVVFAKKSESINLDGSLYQTSVRSYTHQRVYNVIMAKKFITPEDHVLVIDDFMANGCAARGLIDIIEEAGATLEGIGIVIEKVAYRPLRNASSSLAVLITAIGVSYLLQNVALLIFGADTKSLAIIEEMSDDSLTFAPLDYYAD